MTSLVNYSYIGSASSTTDSNNGFSVSRPLRKLEEKKAPENLSEYIKHSTLPAGCTILIVNEDNPHLVDKVNNRFFIQSFQMSYREKSQLVETFGPTFVSFFGQGAKIYEIMGQAIEYPSESPSLPHISMQATSLNFMYHEYLRATQLIKNKQIGVLKIFNHTIYGYPIRFNIQQNGAVDKLASFSMSWVVADHIFDLATLVDTRKIDYTLKPTFNLLADVKKEIDAAEEVIKFNNSLLNLSEAKKVLGIKDFIKSSAYSSSYRGHIRLDSSNEEIIRDWETLINLLITKLQALNNKTNE